MISAIAIEPRPFSVLNESMSISTAWLRKFYLNYISLGSSKESSQSQLRKSSKISNCVTGIITIKTLIIFACRRIFNNGLWVINYMARINYNIKFADLSNLVNKNNNIPSTNHNFNKVLSFLIVYLNVFIAWVWGF